MKKRKERLKDFKVEYYKENGRTKNRVIYTGKYYFLDLEEKKISGTRIEMVIYGLIVNFFLFVSLFVNTLSAYKIYVVIPQILSLAMGVFALYFFFPFLVGVKKYNSKQKEDVLVAPKGYFISKCVFLSMAIVARIVMMAVEINQYDVIREVILMSLCVLCLLLVLREIYLFSRIKIKTPDQTSEEESSDSSSEKDIIN